MHGFNYINFLSEMDFLLVHNKSDISKVTFFLRECKRMELDVLGPNVNESGLNFTVNPKGQVRFGMSALKGVGEGPVEAFLEERTKNGPFKDIFEMGCYWLEGLTTGCLFMMYWVECHFMSQVLFNLFACCFMCCYHRL